jgi:hypothetical protein
MSTRQKPLLASCVYFDRQRFALGLPRIAQGLDRLDSSSLSVSTWPPTARHLAPDVIDIDGPVPACGEPAGLMMSAEQVWAVSWPAWTPTHLDLVLAVLGHAGSGGSTRNSSTDSAGQCL